MARSGYVRLGLVCLGGYGVARFLKARWSNVGCDTAVEVERCVLWRGCAW